MTKSIFVVSCFAVTLAVAPACATKKFVRTEVGQVNDKVTTIGKSLEETQERVRVAEGRITEVDTKAQAAGQSAQQANAAAQTAQTTGNQAMEVGKQASARAEAVEASTRKLIFETVLTDDQAKFKSGVAKLSDEAKAALDQMVAQVKAQKSAIWVEIEGHTDNVGGAAYNQKLSEDRAASVRNWLVTHGIGAQRLQSKGFGLTQPVADNATDLGRARNRRVELVRDGGR